MMMSRSAKPTKPSPLRSPGIACDTARISMINGSPDDLGGETYKGVTRAHHSKWAGWTTIDLLKNQGGFPANLEHSDFIQLTLEWFF